RHSRRACHRATCVIAQPRIRKLHALDHHALRGLCAGSFGAGCCFIVALPVGSYKGRNEQTCSDTQRRRHHSQGGIPPHLPLVAHKLLSSFAPRKPPALAAVSSSPGSSFPFVSQEVRLPRLEIKRERQ